MCACVCACVCGCVCARVCAFVCAHVAPEWVKEGGCGERELRWPMQSLGRWCPRVFKMAEVAMLRQGLVNGGDRGLWDRDGG